MPGEARPAPARSRSQRNNAERLREAGTLLLGRNTYELFKGSWPQMADNPDATPAHR